MIDIIAIAAIFIAPLLAVQASKFLEHWTEKRNARLNIFKTLMATRASKLSPDHVMALNRIDLEFNDKKYKHISDAWKLYLDHLNKAPKKDKLDLLTVWQDKGNDLLNSLLSNMGKSLGYDFDEVYLKNTSYYPEEHFNIELEQKMIRNGFNQWLYGRTALKIVDANSLPTEEEKSTNNID